MRWTKQCGRGLVWVLSVVVAAPCFGMPIDEAQNFQLRLRAYSRFSIRVQDSDSPPGGDTVPVTKMGQMVEHRNFYNPEFEGKLTPYWPSWLAAFKPDDLSFRVAAWGFYDGIYDYGPKQFRDAARRVNAGWPRPLRLGAFYLEGPDFVDQPTGTVESYFPHVEVQNPRDIYATRRRINELYLNFSKGPLFVRIGRQAISWGEADTVALLDQNNPFDVTLGAPGIFQEIDEARIPLWTIRTSLSLFETLGPLSSGFAEAYWVPGDLDVNTGILPLLGVSPYSPGGKDPQQLLRDQLGPLYEGARVQFVLQDLIPRKRFENSRYGFRVQTVINRFFTVSGWVYTTFPQQPVPLGRGLRRTPEGTSLFITQTVHNERFMAFGLANTFFVEPIDSIIRMQVVYFDNEPGFIPEINLGITKDTPNNPLSVLTACYRAAERKQLCTIPTADVIRWELGIDRFFFARFLNPSNSFTWITAFVGSWNLDETNAKDFRLAGQRKPGRAALSPDDYVQQKAVEAFVQTHLETNYAHGRVTPGITLIGNVRGTYVVNPVITYRMFDWLLFDLNYIHIGGEYQQVGFFRDRDQVSARVTYQLN
ncbi:MAG: DUF1302 domain-containing protein [Candidatus Binatia bacterium]|nr:DUF1302 domain-containing protein [Candidatus Binatia bacterium]